MCVGCGGVMGSRWADGHGLIILLCLKLESYELWSNKSHTY